MKRAVQIAEETERSISSTRLSSPSLDFVKSTGKGHCYRVRVSYLPPQSSGQWRSDPLLLARDVREVYAVLGESLVGRDARLELRSARRRFKQLKLWPTLAQSWGVG